MFGRGMAEGSKAAAVTWNRLRTQVQALPPKKVNYQALRGFLEGLRRKDSSLADELLERAVEDEIFGFCYPALEAAADIDSRGAKRLMRSLELGKAPVRMFNALVFGGVTKPIPPREMRILILELAAKPDGFEVAMEVLYMRLHGENRREGVSPEVAEAGRMLLGMITFRNRSQREDYRLAEIAKACLVGEAGIAPAADLCRKLKNAVWRHETHISYYDDLLLSLFTVQPRAALDAFCGGGDIELEHGFHLLNDIDRLKSGVFSVIPESELFAWCDEQPSVRYPAIAGSVAISTNDEGSGSRAWTNIALRVLEKAPDRVEVLKRYVEQIRSSGGWGSRSGIMEAKAKLLDKLENYPDPKVVTFISEEKARLAHDIALERRFETSIGRAMDERFEY
jgi:hypothetical protein